MTLRSIYCVFRFHLKDLLYDMIFADHTIIKFKTFDPSIKQKISKLKKSLNSVCPKGRLVLIGSTGLEIFGAGDIDVLYVTPKKLLSKYAVIISSLFNEKYHQTDEMYQWKFIYENEKVELDLLSASSGRYKKLIAINRLLSENKELLSKYIALKREVQGKPAWIYYLKRIFLFAQYTHL